LTELKNILLSGEKLKIKSKDKLFNIVTLEDYRDWLKYEFKGYFEKLIGIE